MSEQIDFRSVGFTDMAASYPRAGLALEMFAAFNNVTVEQLPEAMRFFPNESTKRAWERVAAAAEAAPHTPPPSKHLVAGRWLPIEQADKSVDRIYNFPGVTRPIGNSEEYWCRDADGRIYLATWADDGERAYWWDLDGESPADPVEFMAHPLDPRWSALATTEGQP